MTWQLRSLPGLLGVLLLAALYSGRLCFSVRPGPFLAADGAAGRRGDFVQYGLLVTYRVVFEQREQRRVKSIFSRVVSPNVAKELLGRERLSLGGARCEVTVLFADVRGFTEITDQAQEQ